MTPADIVAEALAHAEDAVPQSIGRRHDQYVIVDEDRDVDDSGWGLVTMADEQHVSTRKPRVVYVRHDAMLAALAHLAARVVEERERAERMRKGLDDVMHAICENTLRGEGEHAGAVCKRAIEADGEVPHG